MLLLPVTAINEAISRYALWHSRYRPHQGLLGLTPDEVFHRRRRWRRGENELQDLSLTHFGGDRLLPVYRRVLAA